MLIRKYFVFIVLLAGVIIFSSLNFFKPSVSSQKTQTIENKPKSLTGLEIAKGVASFLDNSWTSEGEFYSTIICVKASQKCEPDQKNLLTHTGQIIALYYDLAKATKDNSYQKKADQAIEKVLVLCQEQVQHCEMNFVPLNTYYQDTKDEKYKEALLSTSDSLLSEKTIANHLIQNVGIKYEMLYNLTKDEVYKNELIKYADMIVNGDLEKAPENITLYNDETGTVRLLDFRAISFDLLPAYRLTKDEKYLIKARQIVKKAKFAQKFPTILESSTSPKPGDTSVPWKNSQFVAIVLGALSGLSKEDSQNKSEYQSQVMILAKEIARSFLDRKENKKYNGDNGILSYAHGDTNTKDTLNNGGLARTFLKFNTQVFSVE